jgi:formamidopyrimidine-DNA glycosylase
MTQFPLWSQRFLGATNQWASLKSDASIFVYMVENQGLFCGIGTSHCSEILHIAEEHPATKARIILSHPQRRQAICNAINTFYDQARSAQYRQRVPATSAGSAFYESPGVTRFINEMFH